MTPSNQQASVPAYAERLAGIEAGVAGSTVDETLALRP